MNLSLTTTAVLSVEADALVVGLFHGEKRLSGPLADIDGKLDGALSKLLADEHVEGKHGQSASFPTFGTLKARKVVIVGLGDRKRFDADAMRRFGAQAVKAGCAARAESACVALPASDLDARSAAQAIAEGVELAAYRFHAYHGTLRKKDAPPHEVSKVKIALAEPKQRKLAEEGMARGTKLAQATNYARDLVNTPSRDMGPAELAEEATKLAGKGISVTIMDRSEMEKLGMHAALSVGAGSQHEPVGVHLSYAPRGAKRTVAVVGKAVTFDSGGLNVKTGDGMTTMKIDMAGAASVLGLFKALATFRPNVAVHGIFLAVENMPGGSAYRPGDVVKAMDGTTIEVLNTDAEGRITLADALAYAKTLEPNAIVDLATLTGACVTALGDDIAGLMSNDRKLADRVLRAAKEAGEPLWELPLYEPYMDHVKSKIADIKNIGVRGSAGTISAALFLKPFVGSVPWAHLDIAGPSYAERETRPDQPYGGTGYGVRTLVRLLEGIR